jgi:hypothetical protein
MSVFLLLIGQEFMLFFNEMAAKLFSTHPGFFPDRYSYKVTDNLFIHEMIWAYMALVAV